MKKFLVAFLLSFTICLLLAQDNLYTADGPAELPRVYFNSAISNTPSLGAVVPVAAGGDLAAAYAAASCGQTLSVAHGNTFKLPAALGAKNCPDSAWITITSDGVLPAEGTRITPASLPQMAVLMSAGGGTVVNADHVRFIGLAYAKPVGSRMLSDFVQVVDGSHDIVFDRVYMHGNPLEETTRGILLGAVSRFALVDSWLDEFHCIAVSGSCSDSQAIAGGGGSIPSGTIKIVNSYLQAAGENIMFGGGAFLHPETDVEIRRNHLDKPLSWLDPTVMGTKHYIVKNLLELKNGERVLIEGNVLTGSWGGYSQAGFAIVLTPKNQSGVNGSNICPTCIVTDVTIRYNSISHVGGGFQIANVLSDNGGAALDGQRYSIHDVIVDDISGAKYTGSGELAEVATQDDVRSPLLQNVTIDHVTAFPAHFLLVVGTLLTRPMHNFVFTNNLVSAGQYPVWSMGGGPTSCAYTGVPITTITACFQPGTFSGNIIAADPRNYGAAKWPAGNTVLADIGTAGLVNYLAGNGGDYHLAATSPYKGKATNGGDPGADIDAVVRYTLGVQ